MAGRHQAAYSRAFAPVGTGAENAIVVHRGVTIDSGLLALLGAGWQGFGLGLGLIVAIGAQNAFVLRQGLRRRHVALVVVLCTICDSALITLGAVGVGTLVASSPILTKLAVYGGAAFLIVYGGLALKNALKPSNLSVTRDDGTTSTRAVVSAALGVHRRGDPGLGGVVRRAGRGRGLAVAGAGPAEGLAGDRSGDRSGALDDRRPTAVEPGFLEQNSRTRWGHLVREFCSLLN